MHGSHPFFSVPLLMGAGFSFAGKHNKHVARDMLLRLLAEAEANIIRVTGKKVMAGNVRARVGKSRHLISTTSHLAEAFAVSSKHK